MKLSKFMVTAVLAVFLLSALAFGGCKAKEGTPPAHNGTLPDESGGSSATGGLGGEAINIDDVFSEEEVTPPTIPT